MTILLFCISDELLKFPLKIILILGLLFDLRIKAFWRFIINCLLLMTLNFENSFDNILIINVFDFLFTTFIDQSFIFLIIFFTSFFRLVNHINLWCKWYEAGCDSNNKMLERRWGLDDASLFLFCDQFL